jgi:hypothetical protein
MRTHVDYMDAMAFAVKKTLEGRISPLNFMLILGFISSLVLLYSSLQVHFDNLASNIESEQRMKQMLIEEKAYLTANLNNLTSPERIIPLVTRLGMQAGTADDVRRIAYYENPELYRKEAGFWAQNDKAAGQGEMPVAKAED